MFFYKGEFREKEEVHLSPDDRGYYFGDGVYEVFRIYNGELFERNRHLERLKQSADGIRLNLPYDKQQLDAILDKLVTESNIVSGNLYMQITRGEAQRSHAFPPNTEAVMLAYCTEAERPLKAMNEGIKVITVEDIRWLRCNLKTLNLIPNVLAKQASSEQGADEAILHREGVVTESSIANFMIVKGDTIITHPVNNLILNGVTRAVILELAAKNQLQVLETPFTIDFLQNIDEAFITSTNAEVTPVVQIDHKPVGTGQPGRVTRKLQQLFTAYAHQEETASPSL